MAEIINSTVDSVADSVAALTVNVESPTEATPVATTGEENAEEGLTLRSLVSSKEAGKFFFLPFRLVPRPRMNPIAFGYV
jgi:hypothetical protein